MMNPGLEVGTTKALMRSSEPSLGAPSLLLDAAERLGRRAELGRCVRQQIARAARLSRRDEFEADAYATALMVRSGIGAEHQARLLEKLPGWEVVEEGGDAALALDHVAPRRLQLRADGRNDSKTGDDDASRRQTITSQA